MSTSANEITPYKEFKDLPDTTTPTNAETLNNIQKLIKQHIFDSMADLELLIGNLANLTTTDKSSIVDSINEVNNKQVEYYSSATDTIAITPRQNGILKLTATASTWGFAGGTTNIGILNHSHANQLHLIGGSTAGHDTIPVPVTAIGIYEVEANQTYYFEIDYANTGGSSSKTMLAEITPK